MKLSIILPVYNELETIGLNIAGLDQAVRTVASVESYEILIVDNGSTDETGGRILELIHLLPAVRYLRTSKRGRGPALNLGFQQASGEYVSVLSIDRAWDERFLGQAMSLLESGIDIVYGSKSHPLSEVSRPWFRNLASYLIRTLLAIMFFLRPQDTQCVKVFRKSAIPFLDRLHEYNYFAETEFFLLARRYDISSRAVAVVVRDMRKDSKIRIASFWQFFSEALHFRISSAWGFFRHA